MFVQILHHREEAVDGRVFWCEKSAAIGIDQLRLVATSLDGDGLGCVTIEIQRRHLPGKDRLGDGHDVIRREHLRIFDSGTDRGPEPAPDLCFIGEGDAGQRQHENDQPCRKADSEVGPENEAPE